LGGGEVVEGLVVVAVEGGGLFALELGERAVVPVPEVVGELAYRVIAFARSPLGLFGGEALDGDVGGDVPIFFGVARAELLKEDSAKGGRRFLCIGLGGDGLAGRQGAGGEQAFSWGRTSRAKYNFTPWTKARPWGFRTRILRGNVTGAVVYGPVRKLGARVGTYRLA